LVSHAEGITQIVRAFGRRISGLKRDGGNKGWSKMNSEKLHNLYSYPNIFGVIE
jgi:hypothetical protein